MYRAALLRLILAGDGVPTEHPPVNRPPFHADLLGGACFPCEHVLRGAEAVLSMPIMPSIVPLGAEQDTYLVLEDFGRVGRAWREADEECTDRETLIRDLLAGEYGNPVRMSPSIPLRAGPAM